MAPRSAMLTSPAASGVTTRATRRVTAARFVRIARSATRFSRRSSRTGPRDGRLHPDRDEPVEKERVCHAEQADGRAGDQRAAAASGTVWARGTGAMPTMTTDVYRMLPPEGIKIFLVLSLAFLLGLEREEHKAAGTEYGFGGVRTFPLIGLIGYAVALTAGTDTLPVVLGLAVVAAFLLVSYWHKLQVSGAAGVTSEISALATYLVGALVAREQFWVATTLAVTGLFLLELKAALEGLARRIAPGEILTVAKFLLLTAVVLPVLPNQPFGPVAINPFKTWLVVVAVSAVSYGSYVIQRITKGQGGIALAAVLGGAYSSTVTTLVLARRAAREARPISSR